MIKQTTLIFLLQLTFLTGFSQYKVETIPDPKSQGQNYYVSDPDGIIGSAIDSLNNICAAIGEQSSAEVAIVVIDDFEGSSDFDFAYNLFNHWGIGKAANNNGLLLFIAKDRRRYQFITGYGMEGSLPDVTLGTIGERYLVPKFKEGDYGGGAIDAMNAIKKILQDPDAVKTLKAEARKTSFWYKHQASLLTALLLLIVLIIVYIWMASVSKK
ncbi:TPM domain-containing protein [Niabella ginsengisoli]|uniref:TPM domain-containing protein n=1 Tax=Niabella ginsengisoli TaxID=522298 RepID=A0ABS9SNU2_9BACT|nr:TPM domain-containing protein [Niabella ginsengisoli]MCH5600059.1 TPM domain-containing protein [Niabella ginsengisoli]